MQLVLLMYLTQLIHSVVLAHLYALLDARLAGLMQAAISVAGLELVVHYTAYHRILIGCVVGNGSLSLAAFLASA